VLRILCRVPRFTSNVSGDLALTFHSTVTGREETNCQIPWNT
jgi:hypothetical protein